MINLETKKVKVIVDSTADLPKELAEKYDIDIVPVYIHFEDRMYADGIDLKVEDYYEMLREFKELPTTSAPSPKDFLDKISEAMKNYSSIFVTTSISKNCYNKNKR